MKLTREQAIAEHRKMWLWISRQIMKDYSVDRTVKTAYLYKCDYLNKAYPNEWIKCKCFCCEYTVQHGINCYKDCPLYWNDKHTALSCDDLFEHGYYNVITDIIKESYSVGGYAFVTLEEAKRAARMAYKIAMLDEKKDLYRRLNNVQV